MTWLARTFHSFRALCDKKRKKTGAASKGIRTAIVVSRQNVLPYESLSVLLLVRNVHVVAWS